MVGNDCRRFKKINYLGFWKGTGSWKREPVLGKANSSWKGELVLERTILEKLKYKRFLDRCTGFEKENHV